MNLTGHLKNLDQVIIINSYNLQFICFLWVAEMKK